MCLCVFFDSVWCILGWGGGALVMVRLRNYYVYVCVCVCCSNAYDLVLPLGGRVLSAVAHLERAVFRGAQIVAARRPNADARRLAQLQIEAIRWRVAVHADRFTIDAPVLAVLACADLGIGELVDLST